MTTSTDKDPLLSPTSTSVTHHSITDVQVLSQSCCIHCTLTDYINLRTGDSVSTVSVDDIITTSGQTIMPAVLTHDQFRELIRTVKSKIEHAL